MLYPYHARRTLSYNPWHPLLPPPRKAVSGPGDGGGSSVPMSRLLPVLPLVALGFHQASSSWRRQLLSMACNGETTVACHNGPSCIPWQGEPGVFAAGYRDTTARSTMVRRSKSRVSILSY